MLLSSFILSALLALNPAKTNHRDTTYSLSGIVTFTYHYDGGLENIKEGKPQPLADTRFTVVQWLGEHRRPKVTADFISNEKGEFNLQLPPGKYGIIADGDKPKSGQFKPTEFEKIDSNQGHFIYWSASFSKPIEITNDDVMGIGLEKKERLTCYVCD
jgi:hypothetical protein